VSVIEVIIGEEENVKQLKYRLLTYLFCTVISLGYLFEIIFSKIPGSILALDLINILISTIVSILFLLRVIQMSFVFRIQVLGVLVNMLICHFLRPIDAADFTGIFLRNIISLGMLVPIYGLFSGRKCIFQIGFVYIFIYISALIRGHNLFIIQNAPFLLLNGFLYVMAVYYILYILENIQSKQIDLNNNLRLQKQELLHRNEDLVLSNKQINTQSKELKELVATKDKLFSIIAHDLKSPFNTMLGFSDLMIENIKGNGPESSNQYIHAINSTARQTLILLENLLNWSYTQTGQIEFKPEKLKLSRIIHDITEMLKLSATIKNISLNYLNKEEIFIYADHNMLTTILRNLVSNAIKFTESGGKVDISAFPVLNQIEITIADDGVGINEDTLAKLFNIDTTITTKGTANENGSGLGLILCKEFVELHRGKIYVESIVGKGSKFVVSLPASNQTSFSV
jgi:signal transduction histidine kinase